MLLLQVLFLISGAIVSVLSFWMKNLNMEEYIFQAYIQSFLVWWQIKLVPYCFIVNKI